VIAVHQHDLPVSERVVARVEEVPLRGRGVVGGFPLASLDDDRDRRGQELERADVVEVQVGEHDPRERAHVELLCDRLLELELELEQPGLRAPIMRFGIDDRSWMQPDVDQDALLLRLDQIGGDGKTDPLLWGFALTPQRSRGGDPADVEHLDLQSAPRFSLIASADCECRPSFCSPAGHSGTGKRECARETTAASDCGHSRRLLAALNEAALYARATALTGRWTDPTVAGAGLR